MGSEAGLKAKLRSDLTDAIRARDEIKSGTIRMVLTAITNEEVAGKVAKDLSEAEVITVLSREAKKRREAAEAYEAAGRADKAALEKSEGEIIAGYLPQQMSESEVAALIAAGNFMACCWRIVNADAGVTWVFLDQADPG